MKLKVTRWDKTGTTDPIGIGPGYGSRRPGCLYRR